MKVYKGSFDEYGTILLTLDKYKQVDVKPDGQPNRLASTLDEEKNGYVARDQLLYTL